MGFASLECHPGLLPRSCLMNSLRSCLLILVAVSLVSAAPKGEKPAAAPLLNDAGHGSVSGQFLLDGAIPAP